VVAIELSLDLSAVDRHDPIVESAAPGILLEWADESDTAAFAARWAGTPALANAFVALHGDLGAGKTTLVRHLLQALGVTGRIKSPTYAVVEPYELPALNIWHFDFYRFNDPREWEEAGFRDIFASPGLKLAEWPEKAAGVLPPADVNLYVHTLDDNRRRVRLVATTPAGLQLVEAAQGAGA
jgi:tRNA threonylcarbamoyladenosine biosynthesis protein TsaE